MNEGKAQFIIRFILYYSVLLVTSYIYFDQMEFRTESPDFFSDCESDSSSAASFANLEDEDLQQITDKAITIILPYTGEPEVNILLSNYL